jgi:hypothetical protein
LSVVRKYFTSLTQEYEFGDAKMENESFILCRLNDIINLQNHFANLHDKEKNIMLPGYKI